MSRPKSNRSSRGAARPPCSRAETAYQQLKHDILEGIYTPRQHLVEMDIAAQLNVSRATVRIPLMPEFIEANTATGQFVVERDRYVDR